MPRLPRPIHPRFELRRLLGQGGMGEVYLARDWYEGGDEVALKVQPGAAGARGLRSEFLALRQLRHPGLVRALHFGEGPEGKGAFLTLERVRGEDLSLRWRHRSPSGPAGGGPELQEALRLLFQVAALLAYLHRRGVLHLDLKPSNILVAPGPAPLGPRPILIDFGLARPQEAAQALDHATVPFAAPEVLEGEPPTAAADVFSFGVVLHWALSGALPFPASSLAERRALHRRGAAPPPLEAPQALCRVVSRALARDPRDRYRDGGELLEALTRPPVLETTGGPTAAELVAFHEPDFVGRAEQLAALERWMAEGGRSARVLEVRGAGGHGKTRLLERAQTMLETSGRETLLVKGAEVGPGGLEAMGTAISRRCPPGRESRSASAARGGLRWIEAWLGSGGHLIIDDAHLLGRDDVARVAALAALTRGRPHPGGGEQGGLLLAVRTPDSGPPPPWRELRGLASIQVGPFRPEESLAIDIEGLGPALGRPSADRLSRLKREVHARSGGHPLLFVRGLLDLVAPATLGGRLAPLDRIGALVERLDPPQAALALALAVLSRPVAPGDLARLLGTAEDDVGERAAALRALGLLPAGEASLRLVHESLEAGVLARAGDGEVARLRKSMAARLLEAASPAHLLEAAWQLGSAGDGEAATLAAIGWIDAGSVPGRLPPERAIEALLEAAARRPAPSGDAARLREAAAGLLSDGGRFAESAEALRATVAAGRRGLDPSALVRARALLAAACHKAGRLEEARRVFAACTTPAAERADPASALKARADLALLCHFEGRADEARRQASAARATWAAGSPELRKATLPAAIAAHTVLGQVAIRALELGEATAVLEGGLRLARKAGSTRSLGLLLNNLGLAYHLSGRFRRALRAFREAEALASELGDPAALVSARANLAQVHARLGDFDEAFDQVGAAESEPAVSHSPRLELGCLYTRALIGSLLGAPSADQWGEVARRASAVQDAFLAAFASFHAAESEMQAGDLQKATTALAQELSGRALRASREAAGSAVTRVLTGSRAARLARALAVSGQAGSSRRLRAEAWPLQASTPLTLRAWNILHLGAAALETGDWREAEERLAQSARAFAAMRLIAGAVECSLLRAELDLRRVGVGAPPRGRLASARRHLRDALAAPASRASGASIRGREARAALLEARLLLLEALLAGPAPVGRARQSRPEESLPARARPERGRRGRRSQRGAPIDIAVAVRERIERAAGDAALAFHRDAREALEALTAALERWRGAPRRREPTEGKRRRSPAARRGPARAAPLAARRLGLMPLAPLEGSEELDPAQQETLRSFQAALRSGGAATCQPALDALAAGLAADEVELTGEGGTPVAAAGRRGKKGLARSLPASVIAATAEVGGAGSVLRAWRRAGAPFRASDAWLLSLAADLLAGFPARRQTGSARPPPGLPEPEGAPTRPFEGAVANAKTSALQAGTARGGVHPLSRLSNALRADGFLASLSLLEGPLRQLEGAARSELPILLTGESGTGKSHLARLVHRLSLRASGPFVEQSAGALPTELFEADLFGHEEGAFTGAERARTGYLFRAAQGTFHLAEIGDLSAELQARWLAVIEAKEVRPVGSSTPRPLDVRFLSSTQRDLQRLVDDGAFRADLLYRIDGVRLQLPPLRERREDIAELCLHYWRLCTGSTGRVPLEALEALQAHSWPGNVRELMTVLRRLSLEGVERLSAEGVKRAIGEPPRSELFSRSALESRSLPELEEELSKSFLLHLHARHGGDLDAIARELETSTRSVYRRYEKLGLRPRDIGGGPRGHS